MLLRSVLLAAMAACVGATWQQSGWGVNIHFTNGRPGEIEQISQAYRATRMDFMWGSIERSKGVYDFSAYDGLLAQLRTGTYPITPYWILDYGNPLYDDNLSPYTAEGIQAFCNFTVAAVRHFRGQGVIWEMWNEPNGGFWKPYPNVTAYGALAKAVGRAIRSSPDISGETYIGPATSGIDLPFIKHLFDIGMLDLWDAVSVHPYRPSGPETALAEFENLRELIANYTTRHVPMISGEWGWSTCLPPCGVTGPARLGAPSLATISPDTQADYLARQWLVNSLAGVPMSIYYDYVDDGTDPSMREQRFGTVECPYNNATLPHVPKPSYIAAYTLQHTLGHCAFSQRVQPTNASRMIPELIYIAAFTCSKIADSYAVWTLAEGGAGTCDMPDNQKEDCGFYTIDQDQCEARGCCFQIPAPVDAPQCYHHSPQQAITIEFRATASRCFNVIGAQGDARPPVCSGPDGVLTVEASNSPIYVFPYQGE